MHQDVWLLSTSRTSCRGNVMETLESFQIKGTMATMQQCTAASSCSLQSLWISAEIRHPVTFLQFHMSKVVNFSPNQKNDSNQGYSE